MIRVVRSTHARDHVPGAEIWLGTTTPGTEVPERVEAIESALADWPTIEAVSHGDDVLLAVHDDALVEHLRTVWDAQPLADLDSEEYYDYQVNRPIISMDESGIRSLTWPSPRI
ncbi:MAG: PAC2 family protein, partial [Candidatus Nanopelagicales bacterium]